MAKRTLKVAISYPPIVNERGQKAMVSQNRNVQFFKTPTYLLPVIHAQAATWLKELGFKVRWDDGNSQLKTYDQWYKGLVRWQPDVVVFESTTPVMKFYWKLVDQLKKDLPKTIVIMSGYHSMRKPEETLEESKTDIVLKSNHIDFALNRLLPFIRDNKRDWRKKLMIEGFTIRESADKIRDTGAFRQVEPINKSPLVDRDLVKWRNYAYENGNYMITPGTYATSVIRDCMFGKCTFCRYNGPELTFTKMKVEKSLDEYETLINKYGVKEIFDDSGVWYRGEDAKEFARGIIERGLHKKCYFGINTRFEYLDEETIKLLGEANFRFVLIGLESGSDETLRRLDKGYQKKYIERCLKWMTKYGLHPHLTVMVGYYWETKPMLQETVDYVKYLMYEGLARTLQVTLCTPLDYTPYHQQCIDQGLMLTNDYNDFDMSKLIVKTPEPHETYYQAVREMYGIALNPKFLWRQIRFLANGRKKDWQFLFSYGIRALRRVTNHYYNLTVNSTSQSPAMKAMAALNTIMTKASGVK